jgi:hypothetical protein
MGHEYRSGCAFSSTGRNRYRVLARIGRPTGVRWDSIWTDHQEEAFLTSTHLCIATTSIPAGRYLAPCPARGNCCIHPPPQSE